LLTDLSCTGTIAELEGDLVQVIFIKVIHPVFGTVEIMLDTDLGSVLDQVSALLPPADITMIIELFFRGMMLASYVLAEGVKVMQFGVTLAPSTFEDRIALRGGSSRYLDKRLRTSSLLHGGD
jgi:hypothetical protein